MVTIAGNRALISRRWETAGLAFCGALALLVGILFLAAPQIAGPRELMDWERDSLKDLNADDQAMFSALTTSAVEIGWINYDSLTWPSPEKLDQYQMPPFAKDAFWQTHGSVEWELIAAGTVNDGGTTVYFGHNGQHENQSAYLLVFQHRHIGGGFTTQADVWIHQQNNPPPPTAFLPDGLVQAGWKRVVSYSGAVEAQRIRGN